MPNRINTFFEKIPNQSVLARGVLIYVVSNCLGGRTVCRRRRLDPYSSVARCSARGSARDSARLNAARRCSALLCSARFCALLAALLLPALMLARLFSDVRSLRCSLLAAVVHHAEVPSLLPV